MLFILSALIFFSVVNYIVIDMIMRKYRNGVASAPVRCTTLENHNFVNNKCKWCNKTLNELLITKPFPIINNNSDIFNKSTSEILLKKPSKKAQQKQDNEQIHDLSEV
jgi:hypothetical protein